MTPIAQPPLQRRSMRAEAWAGHPLGRLARRAVHGKSPHPIASEGDRRPLMFRRVLLLVLVSIGAIVGTHAMAEVLPERGAALAEKGLLVLFGILFAWISAGFWTGVLGTFVLVFQRGRGPLSRRLGEAPVRPLDPAARTAIVMPICNEHVPTVFGGLGATIDSLVATGESAHFDAFILSDSSDADIVAAEQAAWSDLASRHARSAAGDASALRVHYRCGSGARSARPAMSPISVAAGRPTTATSSSSMPTAS